MDSIHRNAACVRFHIRFIFKQRSRARIEQNGKKNNRFFWCGSVVPQFDVNKMAMNENIKPKLYCMCYNEFHYMHVRVINKVLYLIAPKLNEQCQTLTTFLYVCFHWEFFQYVSISIRCLYPSNIHAFKIARKVLIRKKKKSKSLNVGACKNCHRNISDEYIWFPIWIGNWLN